MTSLLILVFVGGLLLLAAPGNAFPFGDSLALFGGSTHVKVWRGSMDPTNSAYWRRPLFPMDEVDFERSMHSAATRLAQIPEASSLILCRACWV